MNLKIIKNIAIKSKHNKPIVADCIFDESLKNQPIVIFCHGYKGFKDWGAWQLMLKMIAENGFFVMAFNFSHNGGTLENPIDFPDLEAFGNDNFSIQQDDLQSVIDEVSKSDFEFSGFVNPKSISLIGHSRGGGAAILKAANEHKITKLVTLASISTYKTSFPNGEMLENWKATGVWYIQNQRTQQMMPHYFQFYEDYQKNKENLDIEKAARKIQIPWLIVHGTKDYSVGIEQAKRLAECNPQAKTYFLETDHVFGSKHPWQSDEMPKELAEVTRKVVGFFGEEM